MRQTLTTDELRDQRRVITAAEAQAQLGIPTGTVRSWASRRKLHPVSIGPDGERWYLLTALLDLAQQRRARTRLLAEDPTPVQH